MTEDALISINKDRLKQFIFRLFAGLGILNIWAALLLFFALATVFAFDWLSGLSGFTYALILAFIPLCLFCWWVCYLLSIEFLTEIGIELQGVARLLILPIAIPLVAMSFLLSIWVSAGESINNNKILWLSFVLGISIVLLPLISFL